MDARVTRVLRRTFGLKHLRAGQERVIANMLAARPTLVIMPTGAGKSLCYQLPALLLPGVAVVVSPLIALMKDQCDKLREHGVAAFQLNSGVAAEDVRAAEGALAAGEAKIVFTTPERLADPTFLALLETQKVSLLAVDEAHCISQWGHDFRPAFLAVGEAVARLGKPTVLALTATAGNDVVEDIARQLGVARFDLVQTDLYRPNLRFHVHAIASDRERIERAVELVAASAGVGIVYAATVKVAESLYGALVNSGIDATLYHGRIAAAERRARQEAFMEGHVRVIVATNAFGLGIDKADTRFVLHVQMPSGLDAYYQEAGRAGRDGVDADCTLIFLRTDRAVQQFFLAGRYPSLEDLDAVHRALLQELPDGTRWTVDSLQERVGLARSKLQVVLALLVRERVATKHRDGSIRLARERVGDVVLDSLLAAYRERRESDRAMLEGMVFYGQSGYCRWKVLLQHFGEADGFTACGRCDNCVRIAAHVRESTTDKDFSEA
jgi:ATP-dependent DNA helicase RecQ